MRAWWVGLAFWLAVGVAVSAVVTLLLSVLLLGMPHGWDAATSWADIRSRFAWLARGFVPAAACTHVVVWLCTRERTRTRAPGSPPPLRPLFRADTDRDRERSPRGGRHR